MLVYSELKLSEESSVIKIGQKQAVFSKKVMQNDVMKNGRTPVGIKNLISNSLVQHNQLQYNPSVSCRSNNPNELKPIMHDHINTRFTNVPYKTEVRPEAYSNFVLNNTFKYGVGSQNIY